MIPLKGELKRVMSWLTEHDRYEGDDIIHQFVPSTIPSFNKKGPLPKLTCGDIAVLVAVIVGMKQRLHTMIEDLRFWTDNVNGMRHERKLSGDERLRLDDLETLQAMLGLAEKGLSNEEKKWLEREEELRR